MKPKTSRICIVGAGAAGLSAAYFLKARGYTNVTILEAAGRVGGKCRTVDFQGRSFDIGANYVTAAYAVVRRLARELGAAMYTESGTITASVAVDGAATFNTPLAAIIRDRKFAAFAWAALRYFCIRALLRKIIDRPGFAKISRHPQLCVSFRDWLDNNKLSALAPMFEIPITIMGYGYLDEIPAPYALKYLSPATFRNLLAVGLGLPTRWPRRFVAGFQRLWEAVAERLDVRLGTDVAAIDRDGPVRVHCSNMGVMEFDCLILACPLNVELLERFIRLSLEERDLFGRIVVNRYVVTSYAIPNLQLPRRIVGMTPVPDMGRPWAMTKQYADNDFVQFYTRLHNVGEDCKESVIDAIRRLVVSLGAALPENYVTYDEWAYFPHVSVNDFRGGFYERLEALQGQQNTFYCGGLAAFELVETVAQYSRHVVESYF
jgi:predicted NAD/FAD-binding protein